jgi:dihydrofolate synthase / folylpolyglutamate synthase
LTLNLIEGFESTSKEAPVAQTPYEQCLSKMFALHRFGIKLGLETIQTILARIGNPQNDFPCIHIAGTNGKGSVAAMLAGILAEAGYRVGRYTSPHLEKFNERICIDNEPIDDDAVVGSYEQVQAVANLKREPTFFEFTTAMALYEFSRRRVDWAVIETGMGGRLDATNVIIPALSVITNISLEHRAYLGNTIAAIAGEKAGIIKAKVPVVTGVTQQSARLQIFQKAERQGAPVYLKNRDFRCRRLDQSSFTYYGMAQTWPRLQSGLHGAHQVDNAALVLAACETLAGGHRIQLPLQAIRDGLKKSVWPGRLEVVSDKPCLILDGAHNLMAARVLARHLAQRYQNRDITLVVGVLDDKPCESILSDLAAACRRAVITQPKIDRAIPAERLAAVAKKYFAQVRIIPDVGAAVRHAIGQSQAEDVVCVAGSLYVVGEAKTALRAMGIGI